MTTVFGEDEWISQVDATVFYSILLTEASKGHSASETAQLEVFQLPRCR